MLINLYKKTLDVISQWFDFTGVIIDQGCQPVRIRIKEPENYRQHDVQRKMSALKYKR